MKNSTMDERFPITKAAMVTKVHLYMAQRNADYVNLLEIDQMLLIEDVIAVGDEVSLSAVEAIPVLIKRIGGHSNIGAYVSTLIVGEFKQGRRN